MDALRTLVNLIHTIRDVVGIETMSIILAGLVAVCFFTIAAAIVYSSTSPMPRTDKRDAYGAAATGILAAVFVLATHFVPWPPYW